MSTSEIEETMNRLKAHKGVESIIIYNSEQIPIRTWDSVGVNDPCVFAGVVEPLIAKAKAMTKQLDPTNEFTHMRVRSAKNEILVYPHTDYTLVVAQKA